MLERTLRESRSGVEAPRTQAAPVGDSPPQPLARLQAESPESGANMEELSQGYSLGTYRGLMQRAPRTNAPDPEPSPNPEWLDEAAAHDAEFRSRGEAKFAGPRKRRSEFLQGVARVAQIVC